MPTSLLIIAASLAALLLFPALYSAVRGPSIYDRIVAINVISTISIIVISLLSFAFDATSFLDVALVYAMCGFIGTTAIIKAIRSGSLGGNTKP